MKVKLLVAALMAMSVSVSSCSKDDDEKKPSAKNQNTLGADTKFRATINGASWTSESSGAAYGEVDEVTIISVFSQNANGGMYIVVPDAEGTFTTSSFEQLNGSVIEGQLSNAKGWHSNPEGTATVTITKLDRTNKKISGTFSFTAKPLGNATGDKTVTNGTFTDVTIHE